MIGYKIFAPKLYYNVSIEDYVDEEDYYRKLDAVFPDLSYLRNCKEIKDMYGTTGNPSIDPEIFFRIEFVAYIENEISDRKTAKYIRSYMPARWFIKYDLDEPTPVHSTISRTRQKMPLTIYKQVFKIILTKTTEAGLVGGKHQSQDTTLIKANASLESLERKSPELTIKDRYTKAIEENKEEKSVKNQEDYKEPDLKLESNKNKKKNNKLSNKDYEHKYEPEAKIAKKPSQKTDMYYKGNLVVDSKMKIITYANVLSADIGDNHTLKDTLEELIGVFKSLRLKIESYSADKTYCSEENLKYLSEKEIEAYIPQQKHVNTTGLFDKSKFKYKEEKDVYICPSGNELIFKGIKDGISRVYACNKDNCQNCKLREKCTTSKERRRSIKISVNQKYIDELKERLKTEFAKEASIHRKTGPEGVNSQLKNQLGLNKFLVHGLEQVNKKFILGAAAYNIKKLIKYGKRPPKLRVLEAKIKRIYNETIKLIRNRYKKVIFELYSRLNFKIQLCES